MNQGAFRRASAVLATAMALSLGAATTAHAAGVEPAKATPVQREQAQSRFLKGRELYGKKKYDAALVELTASLDIVASPNTRLYVGRCLREMGRTVAAYAELGRAAVEAKELVRDDNRYEKAAQAATEERAKLVPKLAFVDVRVARAGADTRLTVGGDEVSRGGWDEPVPILPGTADVVVETPGHEPVRQQVQVAAGQHHAVELDANAEAPASAVAAAPAPAEAPPPTRPKLKPFVYATAGLAVAGLATFFVAGAMANGTYSSLTDACGTGPCPPGHEDDISAGKTQQTIANIGLAVFVVSAAATVTLFVVSRKQTSTTAASARVTAGPSFVGLQGAF